MKYKLIVFLRVKTYLKAFPEPLKFYNTMCGVRLQYAGPYATKWRGYTFFKVNWPLTCIQYLQYILFTPILPFCSTCLVSVGRRWL